jgi:1-deoxy-D-xylulose-5-phosphate reductoisomerase
MTSAPMHGAALRRRELLVLGSTGSIGTQALDIVRRNPERFRVVGLGAGGDRVDLLVEQAAAHRAEVVAVADPSRAATVEAALRASLPDGVPPPKLLVGPQAMTELAGWPLADGGVVLNAMTGSIGLAPTLAALDAGHALALANKESLVAGGPIVSERAQPGQIVPVDSEHSALAQCLRGGARAEVRRLVLTASGGPFRGWPRERLETVTPAMALAHPTWDMGPVNTINSATLVNKGLELIEAHLLFGIDYADIDVVVHPQSIVHSMVTFADGATVAQASPPDMRLPIALALAWPDRVDDAAPALDFAIATRWDFEPLDEAAFPAVGLARAAGRVGGTAPAVFNAANEECVAAFVAGHLAFPGIVGTVERVLTEHSAADGVGNSVTLADVLESETWARARAQELTGWSGASHGEETT